MTVRSGCRPHLYIETFCTVSAACEIKYDSANCSSMTKIVMDLIEDYCEVNYIRPLSRSSNKNLSNKEHLQETVRVISITPFVPNNLASARLKSV